MDEPLFESTRNAIKFAFGYSTEQYGESVLGKLQRRDAGSGKGLVGMDGAGQAGMVLAEVWRLKPLERAAIVARFATRRETCPCCGGDKPTAIWWEAIEQLADRCVPAGTSNVRCRRDLVAKYFGVAVEFSALADRYKLNRKTLSEHYHAMRHRLDELETKAQMAVDDAFKASGLVLSA